MMLVLVTYDVCVADDEGKKRLRHVARECMKYGQRVQNSVFECLISPSSLLELKNAIRNMIDETKDSIRYYNLGDNYHARIEQYGKKSYDPEGILMI